MQVGDRLLWGMDPLVYATVIEINDDGTAVLEVQETPERSVPLEPPPPVYEDVILAYPQFRGPLPEPDPDWRSKFTLRQRIRIWRYNKRCKIEQWIHDHLQHAHCDC